MRVLVLPLCVVSVTILDMVLRMPNCPWTHHVYGFTFF